MRLHAEASARDAAEERLKQYSISTAPSDFSEVTKVPGSQYSALEAQLRAANILVGEHAAAYRKLYKESAEVKRKLTRELEVAREAANTAIRARISAEDQAAGRFAKDAGAPATQAAVAGLQKLVSQLEAKLEQAISREKSTLRIKQAAEKAFLREVQALNAERDDHDLTASTLRAALATLTLTRRQLAASRERNAHLESKSLATAGENPDVSLGRSLLGDQDVSSGRALSPNLKSIKSERADLFS
jgi:pyruvate/oxaloacetate carboxyltransferase